MSKDPRTDGIVLQLPLPVHLHPQFFRIVDSIDPSKDIDCISTENYKNICFPKAGEGDADSDYTYTERDQDTFCKESLEESESTLYKNIDPSIIETQTDSSNVHKNTSHKETQNQSNPKKSLVDYMQSQTRNNNEDFLALRTGSPKIFPCTALAIDQMLFKFEVPCLNQRVVILGKSYLVGTPINSLFVSKGAKVHVCNVHTKNKGKLIREADILVSCTGSSIRLGPGDIKEGVVIFDVGINVDPETGAVKGDICIEGVKDRVAMYTPVPGGLGPLTVANMIHNLYMAFLKRRQGGQE